MFKRPQKLPWMLIICLLTLCSLSVYNLEGTTGPHIKEMHKQQLQWLFIASPMLILSSHINLHALKRFAPLIYISFNGLLLAVLLMGKVVNGSRRWIDLGVFNFQPSEIAKIGLVITLSAWFQRYPKPIYELYDLSILAMILGLPMSLVFLEPDLGHTLMLMLIAISMFSIERFNKKTVLSLIVGGLSLSPVLWTFVLKRYQRERILTLIDGKVDTLGAGWHSHQAEISIGAGGILGQGKGMGTQVAGGFLPENHTDFVFAKLAEENGLIGASFTLGLYLLLIFSVLYTANTAKDRFGRHLALGVASIFFWHIMMNIGMVLNLLPVTGVTLPILSYGGTSLVTVFITLGLVIAVHGQRQVFE